jgi:cystathionine beta-lyase
MESKKTVCVHEGNIVDERVGGTNTPIHTSTSFAYLDNRPITYPRYFNTVNQEAVVRKMNALEYGENSLVFSSGMAAISTTLLSLLKSGDHALFQNGLYGGTFNFITTRLQDFSIEYTVVEDNSEESFKKAIRPNTKAVYVETPSNPLLNIIDLEMIASLARSNGVVSVADNTFASAINQNPLNFGIDIVLHSATKYLGGHSDICAGTVTSSDSIIDLIRKTAVGLGGSLNALTCYLLERSLKTLAVRVAQINSNAMEVALFLNGHPGVKKVYYPGLPEHPGHPIARKQMAGFGGMVSFELDALDSVSFQKKLRLIRPSVSLGGVESIICSPALTSHARLSREERMRAGISDGLLRLSVGIEEADDLIFDLKQAFPR